MSVAPPVSTSQELAGAKQQLRREMGFWDVLLFNIATVLGPRWVAAAAHNGTSSISLWILAAAFFFVPYGLVINELSSRFPVEGGLYVWAKEAFGDFHGFVAGWNYWIYTVFYFPGLLLASAAMCAYIVGSGGDQLAQNRTFLLLVSFALLAVAVVLNIVGLNIGKWLQNAGGVSTYVPLLMLVGIAAVIYHKHGSVTPFTWATIWPHWNWDTVNFWSQIAFAFTGLELVSAMSEEIREPQRTLPRALFGSSILIAGMYIVATAAVLVLAPAAEISPTSGVFHAVTVGSVAMGVGFLGIAAAMLVTVGNAGGVGSTVAGIARVPFIVGIDRYLAGIFRENSSEVAHAVGFDSGAGGDFGRGFADQPDQRFGARRLRRTCEHHDHHLFHSVSVYVRGGDQAGEQAGSSDESAGGVDSGRENWSLVDGRNRILDCAGVHGDFVGAAGRFDEQVHV